MEEAIMKMPLEEVINKIPKLYDDNYQFRILYINFGYSIGYIKAIDDLVAVYLSSLSTYSDKMYKHVNNK